MPMPEASMLCDAAKGKADNAAVTTQGKFAAYSGAMDDRREAMGAVP